LLTQTLLLALPIMAGATEAEEHGVPHVVTADIQAGIEEHIERESERGGGYFQLPFQDEELRLKLVRVHTEYLSNLGPGRHFACVDLVDTKGDVYDVDFFLEGDPGHMTVTETTVHKINGKPYYYWEQGDDGTWVRIETDEASRELMGVVEGQDHFEFRYSLTIPELDGPARMWIPLATSDRFQSVSSTIDAPAPHRILEEERHGNEVLFLELDPEHSGGRVEVRSVVRRSDKAAYPAPQQDAEPFIAPAERIPITSEFHQIAHEALAGKTGDLVRARALYDHTIEHMEYIKVGEGYGHGDAVYACDAATGNCTDFHSYFIALSRASGIPARFAIGAAVPSERDEGAINGYHCWAEFYADGKWWPIDISEADKYTALATYYFGHNPANRIELSRGRDLVVTPGPESGPINFLAYPVLEVEGRPVPIRPIFSFKRLPKEEADSHQGR